MHDARSPQPVQADDFLTRTQAAAFLQLERHTLTRWAKRGQGPPFKRIGRLMIYPVKGLDDYAASRSGKGR